MKQKKSITCESCEAAPAAKKATLDDHSVVYLCTTCAARPTVRTRSSRRNLDSDLPVDSPRRQQQHSITGGGRNRRGPPPLPANLNEKQNGIFWLAFRALMAKSFAIQRRQVGTNVVQVVIPLLIIILLYLLQLLVSSIIRDTFGAYRDATPMPRVEAPRLFLPLLDDNNGCNGSSFDFIPIRILTSGVANDIVGSRPRVDNATLDFIRDRINPTTTTTTVAATTAPPTTTTTGPGGSTVATTTTPRPTTTALSLPAGLSTPGVGVLGNLSSSPDSYFGVRARAIPRQGNRVETCFSFSFLGLPDVEVRPELRDTEAEIMKSWFAPNSGIAGAIDFQRAELNVGGGNVSRGGRLEYTMLYNATMTRGNDLLTLLNLFTNAIYRVVTGTTAPVKFQGTISFPAPRSEITFDLQSQIGPLLYVYMFNLLLPVFVVSLVAEKEQGLVQIMRQSGLPDRVYAVVTYLFFLILYVLATGIVILVASILRFRFFIANDIGIVLLFFFVWGHTLIAVSYLFAVFFGKSRTATIVMYLWTFITGILSGQLVINFFQSPDTPPAINGALMIVPTFVMFRGLIDLSKFTSNGGTGMTWEDLSSGAASNMLGAFTAMPIMWAVCLVLAWYLGNVLPGAAGGAPKSPLFFLPKALRTLCVRGAPDSATTDIRRALVKEADDVVVERLRTERHAERDHATHNLVRADVPRSHELQAAAARDDDFHRAHVPPAVRMYNLRKTFTSRDGKPFVAVNGVSMSLFRGQCLGLVGPNGAGKSTLIAMLSGQLKPTSGEAFVEDDSIVEDLEHIYRHMGVCPQNDVLWADLTAAETLKFYATLKGLTGRARDDHVEYWLEQVDLVAARNRVTSTYSGGMRRRLCVACSMIGGPHTVFLDEPSASLDPASRHRLWDVIKANKSTTTMLLTTHSMAEAQELCDRVGIFVDGKMRAIGSPDFLQAKYGAHLKVAITTLPDRGSVSRGQSVLRKITNEARMVSSLAGTSNFEISRGSANLSTLFRQLGIAVEKGDILDFGVGNTSLEEVFVQILFVSQDDKKKGKGGGSGGGDLQRSASKGNLDYIGGDDDSIDDIVELRDDDVDADVPMQNIVAPAVQRSQSQRPQSMRRSEAFSEELGDGELEEVRAKLERAETARSGRLLERANTARSERDLARSNTMNRSLSMRRRIENGEDVDLVERAPDDDPALIVEEGRALSRAPSRRATIRVTDDIVLDLSLSDSEGEYPLIVDDV